MAVQTFSVNADNDIYLNMQGNLSLSFDLQAILQDCEQVAKLQLGEAVLNINSGIPYFQTVWNGVPNLQQFTAALRSAFLAVPGVREVISLMTEQVDDVLTYTAVIRTIYGIGGINGRRI
jgi:hypothetical protein